MDETTALSILTATPLLGSIKIRTLINRFGSAAQTLKAAASEVETLPGFGPKLASHWNWWGKDCRWEKNLSIAQEQKVQLIPYTDPKYPRSLLNIPDYPLLLYVKGGLQEGDSKQIAIVGTRNTTIYGREKATLFGREIAQAGFTVVSGLARGIDTAAHNGALETGKTVAVIGSGLANIYPSENKGLSDKIAERGAVISEYSMLTPPNQHNFPQRNRIVSGMSLGTLLIEAPLKSGAMLTMNNAEQQGRHRWALPGRCDGTFEGNHFLIKNQRAKLVENVEDILSCFGSPDNLLPRGNKDRPPKVFLEAQEISFLKALPNEELNIDQIGQLTKLPIIKLNVLLMGLVMKQVIKEYPGKIFKKIEAAPLKG